MYKFYCCLLVLCSLQSQAVYYTDLNDNELEKISSSEKNEPASSSVPRYSQEAQDIYDFLSRQAYMLLENERKNKKNSNNILRKLKEIRSQNSKLISLKSFHKLVENEK